MGRERILPHQQAYCCVPKIRLQVTYSRALIDDLWRRLYRGNRAGTVAHFVNRVQTELAARGLGPARVVTLEVRARTTGRKIAFPVVLADHAGERYVVSMFGPHVSWVRTFAHQAETRSCGTATVKTSS
jgi:hypothetical protein